MENSLNCPVCAGPLRVSVTRSARGKAAVMLSCPKDGRHLRAFVNDKGFVASVIKSLENRAPVKASSGEKE